MSKIKIAITGIGGVGGFFGGKLAAHFAGSEDTEVYFISRGENLKAIQARGLLVESREGNFKAQPAKATDRPEEIGPVDFLICCTKSYDLEESIEQLRPCIQAQTVILPLLNGVDNSERIRRLLPGQEVWDGCVFIVSRLQEAGKVVETGKFRKLHFGAEKGSPAKLQQAEKLFRSAGIDVLLSDDIQRSIWKKYSFISPLATLTSYLDLPVGAIREDEERKSLLQQLQKELKAVASAKGVHLPENIVQKNIDLLSAMPPESTSSMHSDFQNAKQSEVQSLTGYIVQQGQKLNIPTPTYARMYDVLLQKSPHPKR